MGAGPGAAGFLVVSASGGPDTAEASHALAAALETRGIAVAVLEAPAPDDAADGVIGSWLRSFARATSRNAVVIVSGGGGLMTRIDACDALADLAGAARTPLIVCFEAGSQGLHALRLTREVAASVGLPTAGTVRLGRSDEPVGPAQADQLADLEFSDREWCLSELLPLMR